MEEILKRMGITAEAWMVSCVAATLLVLFRIYETETPPSIRKRIAIIVAGAICALLVPGLVVFWLKVDNAFLSASITGLFVYAFEPVIKILRSKVLKKADNLDL